MKISVERTLTPEGTLVFIITVGKPHQVPVGQTEIDIIRGLDVVQAVVKGAVKEENELVKDVLGLIHAAKKTAFVRVMRSMRFDIANSLETKFDPMVQEIYNWIYDAQEKPVKEWLQEFDPQRSRYYFDNDKETQNVESSDEDEDTECDDEDDTEE